MACTGTRSRVRRRFRLGRTRYEWSSSTTAGLAKGGTVSLFIDGVPAGQGRVDQTVPMVFSADETLDVGFEAGSPVTYDYPKGETKFSGEVNWVEIDLGKDAVDLEHLISPEERLRVAMAIQ